MPDIGFWELCIIAVVALVVLGPERLPTAARTTARWFNKARSMIHNVKSEIDRELQLDEVRQRLREEEQKLRETSGMDDLENLASNTIGAVHDFEKDIDKEQPDQITADSADDDQTETIEDTSKKSSDTAS